MDYLDLKVGYSCNNNCIHCVIKDNEKNCIDNHVPLNRTTEDCKREIAQARSMGAKILTLTGGEPTIRRDILEIASYAKSLGYSIGLQTNGRSFYYRQFSEKISAIGISCFVIALHSNREEIHDLITRKKGSFRQTVQGIRNLVELGQEVHGKIVLSKLNYNHIKDLIEFLYSDLGVKTIFVAFPHGSGNAWKYRDKVIPRYKDISPYINEMLSFAESHRDLSLNLETFPFCTIRNFPRFFAVLPNEAGTSGLRNLDHEGTIDWNSIRPMIKSKSEKCSYCKYFTQCEGPWDDYARLYGTDEFIPIR